MQVFDKENFESEVLEYDGLVLVDFWSPKCEPCKELLPEVESLAEKYVDQVKFGKVDVSKNRRLAISQKVMGLPAIVIYKNGEIVVRFANEISISLVEEKLKELL